jgi:type IV pilus assembly protein PilX
MRQRGAVLVVSLIILVVITVIAAGSMRGTILEEKMAGNTRDRNLAFQAAESAAREAELFIESLTSMGGFNGSAGLYGRTDSEPSYSEESTWTDSNKHIDADFNYGAYQAPKFFIKHFTTVVNDTEGALNMSGYGDNKGAGDVAVFKITVRGTGASAESAEVMLRSYYARAF